MRLTTSEPADELVAPFPRFDETLRRVAAIDGLCEIERLFANRIASWQPCGTPIEMRRARRVAYGKPLLLTCLADGTDEPIGPPRLVDGRDLSLAGVSFSHCRPIASRRVAISFFVNDDDLKSAVVALRWCRFTAAGNYHSGGQFLRDIALALDPAADWRRSPSA